MEKYNNNYILTVDLAGHDPKGIEIEVNDELLHIYSERKVREWEKRANEIYNRTWELYGIECDDITSEWDNGRLIVTLPPRKRKSVKVEVR